MSKAELTPNQKKEWAQQLYLTDQFTQKEIAIKVKVNEATLSRWVTKENWDGLKKSLLTSKNEILRKLYNHLSKVSDNMEGEMPDSKTADAFLKLTAAINNLESETNVAQIMEVGRIFINRLMGIDTMDQDFILKVTNEFDALVKEKLKRF